MSSALNPEPPSGAGNQQQTPLQKLGIDIYNTDNTAGQAAVYHVHHLSMHRRRHFARLVIILLQMRHSVTVVEWERKNIRRYYNALTPEEDDGNFGPEDESLPHIKFARLSMKAAAERARDYFTPVGSALALEPIVTEMQFEVDGYDEELEAMYQGTADALERVESRGSGDEVVADNVNERSGLQRGGVDLYSLEITGLEVLNALYELPIGERFDHANAHVKFLEEDSNRLSFAWERVNIRRYFGALEIDTGEYGMEESRDPNILAARERSSNARANAKGTPQARGEALRTIRKARNEGFARRGEPQPQAGVDGWQILTARILNEGETIARQAEEASNGRTNAYQEKRAKQRAAREANPMRRCQIEPRREGFILGFGRRKFPPPGEERYLFHPRGPAADGATEDKFLVPVAADALQDGEACVVCMETLEVKEDQDLHNIVVKLPVCGHLFHRECISDEFDRGFLDTKDVKCPCCRQPYHLVKVPDYSILEPPNYSKAEGEVDQEELIKFRAQAEKTDWEPEG